MYIHLETSLMTTLFLSLFIGQKQWREKNDERGKEHNVSMREKIIQKLSQNGYINIISLVKTTKLHPI